METTQWKVPAKNIHSLALDREGKQIPSKHVRAHSSWAAGPSSQRPETPRPGWWLQALTAKRIAWRNAERSGQEDVGPPPVSGAGFRRTRWQSQNSLQAAFPNADSHICVNCHFDMVQRRKHCFLDSSNKEGFLLWTPRHYIGFLMTN